MKDSTFENEDGITANELRREIERVLAPVPRSAIVRFPDGEPLRSVIIGDDYVLLSDRVQEKK